MTPQIHILNGDALKEQFPASINGDIIVARECMVDGNVTGGNLEEVFAIRASFISQNYGGSKQDYYDKAATEFLKILEIKDDTEINLWFEDDLFCQVNFWFVVDLLFKNNRVHKVFLIRPETHYYYGFGGLKKSELVSIYENRLALTALKEISSLWTSYQSNNFEKLQAISIQLEHTYPFLLTAVQAHIQRTPTNGNLGRPAASLLAIMNELGTQEFGPVFKEFSKRESIYGYGDLHVKKLYDDLLLHR